MASTRAPKNAESIALNGLSKQQALAVAHEAATRLGWKVQYISANGLIAQTDHGMLAWNGVVTVRLEDDLVQASSESADGRLFDFGKNKQATAQFATAFEEERQRLAADELAGKYDRLAAAGFPADEEDILLQPPPTTKERIGGFLSLFKPSEGYVVTPIILDLNILLFIVMAATGTDVLQPDNESLLAWGANFRPMTLGRDWWRLLTNCFIHIGVLHLLMNSYALVVIGTQLEPLLGKARFLAAYLFTGIAASVASLWWHDLTISAGASGAIFGLYGVFLAMLTTNLIDTTVRKQLLSSILVFIVYNLMYGMKGGIDNAAHIGGLLSGLVVGYVYYPSLKRADASRLKIAAIGGVALVVTGLAIYAVRSIPNDIGTYDAKMEVFQTNDRMAIAAVGLQGDTDDAQLKRALENTAIPRMKSNLGILAEVEALNLPDVIKPRNAMLRNYTELRLKTFELMHWAASDSTAQYQQQMDDYMKQTDSLLTELNKG